MAAEPRLAPNPDRDRPIAATVAADDRRAAERLSDPRFRYLAALLALGCGYVGLAELGYVVHFEGDVQAVWMPAGYAAGVLYLTGLRYWPGVLVADAALGLTNSEPVLVQVLQTSGNVAEVLLVAWLLRRLLGRGSALVGLDDVARLLAAVPVGTTVSATVGVLSLWVTHEVGASDVPVVWRTWWLGDGCGALVVAPLIVIGHDLVVRTRNRRKAPRPSTVLWPLAVVAAVVGSSAVGFSGTHPLTYVVFPSLIWAALRYGQPGATGASALAAAIAVALTANHRGPFSTTSIDDTVLSVQLYVVVAVSTTLILGAVVSARRTAAVELAESRRREAEQAALERQHIARDLHDSISQTLFSLTLHAKVAEHALEGATGVDAPGRLDRARQTTREMGRLTHGALAELRALIFELRPDALAEEGLVAALRKQAAAISVHQEVTIDVAGPPERLPLSPSAEEHLYRLAQQALGNAVSHAGPTTIRLEVRLEDDEAVSLMVRDDGCGFDPGASFAGHLGLVTMRERAADVGGTLDITSAPGAGTTVHAVFPARTGGNRA